MKIKYLHNGHRVVCDGEKHHIFKTNGQYNINNCSCGDLETSNSDPKYWEKRRNRGLRCSAMENKKQCQFPEFHEGDHKFNLI